MDGQHIKKKVFIELFILTGYHQFTEKANWSRKMARTLNYANADISDD